MNRRIATMRAQALLLPVAFVLPPALAACGDEAGPAAEDVAAGSYVLESANGHALPVIALTWQDASGVWQARILTGTLTLNDGGYEAGFVVDLLVDGEVSVEALPFTYAGSYTVSGDVVTLHAADAADGATQGRLEGDLLTISQSIEDYGTFTAVYRREGGSR
ncbi:MAG TPA: hypothetical protein VF158_07705 [Longimicrobiales bacterium]